jgi:hypothetical protein
MSSRAAQVNFLMEAVWSVSRKLRFFVESWVSVHPITGYFVNLPTNGHKKNR